LTVKRFLIHLLLMSLLLLLVFGAVLTYLKVYTNHGQKLELENYIGQQYKKSAKHAEKKSFELIVKDSVHRVGVPGGQIISQNPSGGSFVKENRKIYVDVTKYVADEIKLENLSVMYGRNYESKKTELEYLDINSKIARYEHDPGDPGHILEVWYKGQMIIGASGKKSKVSIKKGDTLEFVVSKLDGGQVDLPDLLCREYGQLGFMLNILKVRLGSIERVGAITDLNKAYVIAQNPPYSEGKKIQMGQSIEITIQQEQPESCK